jgi:hypothetical protein
VQQPSTLPQMRILSQMQQPSTLPQMRILSQMQQPSTLPQMRILSQMQQPSTLPQMRILSRILLLQVMKLKSKKFSPMTGFVNLPTLKNKVNKNEFFYFKFFLV